MSTSSTVVKGKSTFYGVITVNDELRCDKCKAELKGLKRVLHVDRSDSYTDMFTCSCGNSIERTIKRGKDDLMGWCTTDE